jgi:hypothetical protein
VFDGTRYTERLHNRFVHRFSASSTLKPEGDVDYDAARDFDAAPESAWAEGTDGTGLGETIRVDFGTPVTLRAVKLMPGCGQSEASWKKNERLKRVTFGFADGGTQSVTLADATYRSVVEAPIDPPQTTRSLSLTVDDVYLAKYKDACISEIDFVVDGPAPDPKLSTLVEGFGNAASCRYALDVVKTKTQLVDSQRDGGRDWSATYCTVTTR